MKKPSIHILANSQTLRAMRTVPGDPSLGPGKDGKHVAEVTLDTALAKPTSDYDERADRLGRFEKGMPVGVQGGMAHGERHGETEEKHRRQALAVAKNIQKILSTEGNPPWTLIAPSQWLGRIEKALVAPAVTSLVSRHAGDWTGEPIAKIESRILGA